MSGKKGQRSFGYVRKLPSKRYQASYVGPDLTRHVAPSTFDTKIDAEAWLIDRRREIQGDSWAPPTQKAKPLTFDEYASDWLATRNLRTRTREEYESLHERRLSPTFGSMSLKSISADTVRRWYAKQGKKTPTATAHAYGLLRTIMGSAYEDRLIDHQPVHIRGAGNTKRKKTIEPATLDELALIVEALPDDKYRLMTLLATWCGLRFGELTELRRSDVDAKNGVLKIRRGVVHPKRQRGTQVGDPKSDAGVRDVAIPPHLMPLVREHLSTSISGGRNGLLFPGADGVSHMAGSTLYRVWARARSKAGRDDLRFHDLRHTGAVLAAQTGATLAELMGRLGHSTPTAAMRYQHVAKNRDRAIAAALSKLVEQS